MNKFVVVLLLFVSYMGTNSVVAADDDIPLETSAYDSNKHPFYSMPNSCAVDNYCFEKGDEYPDDKIAELLKDMRESPVENHQQPIKLQFELQNREGINPTGNLDCPANITYTSQPIYYIVDTNDKVRVVIQSPTKFQQIYSVKWCKKPGRITTATANFENTRILKNFKIECVDTFMDFDFFVLNDDDDKPKIETVKAKGGIPVYCRCRCSK